MVFGIPSLIMPCVLPEVLVAAAFADIGGMIL